MHSFQKFIWKLVVMTPCEFAESFHIIRKISSYPAMIARQYKQFIHAIERIQMTNK